MPLALLFSDDFSGHANQAAFEAAYPYDPPTDMSTSMSDSVVWGLTEGPGGVPGVRKLTGGSGVFDKVNLSPLGHLFRVAGRWDFNYAPSSGNETTSLVNMWWVPPGNRVSDFAGHVFQVSRIHASTTMVVAVKTTSSYANGALNYYSQNFAGALPGSTAVNIRVDGRRSTMTETSPGVFAPALDGWVKVYLNDVEMFSFVGPVWHGADSLNEAPYWNGVSIRPAGRFTNFEIWHEVSAVEVVDNTDVCCSTGDGGNAVPTGGGQGNGATPVQYPAIGTQIECAGGGTVPTQADIVFSETWWG